MTPPTPRVDQPAEAEGPGTLSLPATAPDVTVAAGASPPSADGRAPAGYVIERELGRGGMGVVYLAHHLALHRPCAMKMILSGVHADGEEVERLRTEARAIARLQHPGIVQVFEIGEHDGRPFAALEYCPGGSLAEKLAKNPLAPKDAAALVKKLAEAVHAAHLAQVIHRDLKPANVLLTATGEPKVSDFGLAKKLDEQGATRTGSVMGTPSYMPPEQAEGKKDIGPTADVYALGAILYECLAFRPPFRAATAMETLLQVLTEEPVSVRHLNGRAPVDLETIAHKCLQKHPKKRYATAQELADDLGRYLNGEPIRARPVGAVERSAKWVRRHALVSALAAAVLLVLTAGVAVSSYFGITASEEAKAAREAEKEAKGLAKSEAKAKGVAQEARDRADAEKGRAEEQLTRSEWLVYAGKLSLAQSAFQEGEFAVGVQHLDECRWNLRGWEHRHLWTRFSSKQTFLGHTDFVRGVAGSPDGKRIATGSEDKTAKVWDAEKGRELFTLRGHTKAVSSVAWSPDGRRIVTGSSDETAKVWDAEKGREIFALKWHGAFVTGVAWSPDGKRIVTGSVDTRAKVWDAEKGREILALKGHTGIVTGVAWSPDGKRILTGSVDDTARVWDAEEGREILALKGHTSTVSSVAWSPDGERILTGSWDKTARVWDAEKGRELLAIKGHNSWVSGVAWSPDGKRIATGSWDKTARVWDGEKGQELLAMKGHTEKVTGVAWSPDGKRIATGSEDKTARVWDAEKGRETLALKGHTEAVSSVAWSPDGKRIATGSVDNTARVWDAEEGREILALKGHTKAVSSVAWSPDGKRIATGSVDNTARVWDVEEGREILALRGHTSWVSGVAWSPDGKRILTGSEDKRAKVWDAEKGQELLSLKGHDRWVSSVAWSPDGDRLLTGSWDETAKVWDAQKGREGLFLKGLTKPVTTLAFSPDGRRLFAWDVQKKVFAWSTVTGQPTEAADPPAMPPPGPARSPDGFLTAKANGLVVEVTDKRLVDPNANHWPLPDAAERKRYHGEQAALAEKEKHHFAAAFHLGRLLLDSPGDADLKRRREQALKNHAADGKEKGK